jgi:hypothetical protein
MVCAVPWETVVGCSEWCALCLERLWWDAVNGVRCALRDCGSLQSTFMKFEVFVVLECGVVGYDVTWSSRWLPWLPQLLRSVLPPSCALWFVCECRLGRVLQQWTIWPLLDYVSVGPWCSSGAPFTFFMHLTSDIWHVMCSKRSVESSGPQECNSVLTDNMHCPVWELWCCLMIV